jgi:hypothetical protein
MSTVRQLIRDIQVEVRDTDLQPDRAADLLTKLTALLGNVADECREADWSFNVELLRLLESEEAASRAKIRAETTPQYQRKREARDTAELAKQLCISLRQFLRTKSDEMRMAH